MPSYLLRVSAGFEAAHRLTSYRGEPEAVHGHSWKVEVALAADRLDEEGMAFDFVAVRAALLGLAARLDHQDLNTVPPFDALSPTTERIAAWFHREMEAALPEAPILEVTIWEGPFCSATYRP